MSHLRLSSVPYLNLCVIYIVILGINMKLSLYVLLVTIILVISSSGQSQNISLAERYPGPWQEDFNIGITKALASQQIRGCGEYKYRESSKNKGEYLIYCTSDGKRWVAYLVWVNIGKITGPHTIDPLLK